MKCCIAPSFKCIPESNASICISDCKYWGSWRVAYLQCLCNMGAFVSRILCQACHLHIHTLKDVERDCCSVPTAQSAVKPKMFLAQVPYLLSDANIPNIDILQRSRVHVLPRRVTCDVAAGRSNNTKLFCMFVAVVNFHHCYLVYYYNNATTDFSEREANEELGLATSWYRQTCQPIERIETRKLTCFQFHISCVHKRNQETFTHPWGVRFLTGAAQT